MHRKIILLLALLLLCTAGSLAARSEYSHIIIVSKPDYDLAVGLSVLSPGMPGALKLVDHTGSWGWQLECNYYRGIGMFRLDARNLLTERGWHEVYVFSGITGTYVNDGLGHEDSAVGMLYGDMGIGAQQFFSHKVSFGAEGGILLPLCSTEAATGPSTIFFNLYVLYWY